MFLLLLACTPDPGDSAVWDSGDTGEEVIDVDQDGFAADQDCDDSDAGVNPGAVEVCDGLDNDCDGAVDNQAADATPWYADLDGDGWGGGEPVLSCAQPAQSVARGGDCLDSDPAVNPDAAEVCDALDVDEDCDGQADDADDSVDPYGYATFYTDADGDGLGDPKGASQSCDAAEGQVANDADCDDGDSGVGEQCPGWDGSYTGSFEVMVSVADLGVSDTCSGSAELEVVEDNKTQINGTVACSFSGILASLIGAAWDVSITGGILSGDAALGELELIGLITDSWEGGFYGNTLTGELSGETSYEGFAVHYSGGFEVTR